MCTIGWQCASECVCNDAICAISSYCSTTAQTHHSAVEYTHSPVMISKYAMFFRLYAGPVWWCVCRMQINGNNWVIRLIEIRRIIKWKWLNDVYSACHVWKHVIEIDALWWSCGKPPSWTASPRHLPSFDQKTLTIWHAFSKSNSPACASKLSLELCGLIKSVDLLLWINVLTLNSVMSGDFISISRWFTGFSAHNRVPFSSAAAYAPPDLVCRFLGMFDLRRCVLRRV